MTDEAADPKTTEPGEQPPCGPCRGTGRVFSNLGGEQHEVPCPWCEGTGRFIPEHDAQEHARPAE